MTETTLRDQYEAYPYPPRDPADEAARLVTGSPSHLAEINHYIFAGRRDFSKPFRALVAGGGTGDAAIMMAQQLADLGPAGSVTYLDLSQASLAIAKGRAEARGLQNMEFHHGSLLTLGDIVTGPFDYIDCCGVLHHLDDPAAGLHCLESVLADDGGMGLMVYAPYGRTGVYQMQQLLRMIDLPETPTDREAQVRIEQAKALLSTLPPTNWLRRNQQVSDHLSAGDAGLFDLLLHSQDRAFTVPEIAALADDSSLRIVSFIEPIRYDPMVYLGNQSIARRVDQLSWLDKCAFAELLTGNLKTHVFYTVKSANKNQTVASLSDGAMVPFLVGLEALTTAQEVRKTGTLPADLEGLRLAIPMDDLACDMLMRMDGKQSIDGLFSETRALNQGLDRHRFDEAFGRLFTVLNGLNLAFLRG
ncbi:MAG: class I SAM-dependent methyltransferase [Rhodospirillaceae bacterium]|jgi:SAM-dependent methyltransferase|nr:class I SAM-dependent methyltransferase [Rhodospirillaceae bacterium]MBT5456040.1 class I SAM-dependent methyltransferase [Rhodospirillaceae bacterium]